MPVWCVDINPALIENNIIKKILRWWWILFRLKHVQLVAMHFVSVLLLETMQRKWLINWIVVKEWKASGHLFIITKQFIANDIRKQNEQRITSLIDYSIVFDYDDYYYYIWTSMRFTDSERKHVFRRRIIVFLSVG